MSAPFRRPLGLAAAALLALAGAAAAQDAEPKAGDTVTGTIANYECGDNCYLTIRTAKGAEVVGLCAAPECEKWNETTEMPARFKGKRISATVGQGEQTDNEGNVMGEMIAFDSLKLGK